MALPLKKEPFWLRKKMTLFSEIAPNSKLAPEESQNSAPFKKMNHFSPGEL